MAKISQAEARLALVRLRNNLTPPDMDDAEGYLSAVHTICCQLAKDGNHLGARTMANITEAIHFAYKAGWLHGKYESRRKRT